MKAEVNRDTTIREITLGFQDGPELDVTEDWHGAITRSIQVERLTLRIVDGETRAMTVLGQILKKDGTPGQNTGKRIYRASSHINQNRRDDISTAPSWARLIWAEAPAGVLKFLLEPEGE